MSVVLWRFHMGGSTAETPPETPKRPNGGGGYFAKRKKPHADYLREAAEALLGMEPGTAEYREARRKLKKVSEELVQTSDNIDDELILVLFALDLL